ncbi:MAG: sugar phosphate isomerase/epimerase family protein [Cyclobacteriaceae bacterium]
MNRRRFLQKTAASGAAFAATPFFIVKPLQPDFTNRIGLTTVVFRNRFQATCPKGMALQDELTLLDIPEYFTDRFGIHQIELWAKHFESNSPAYLEDLKKQLKKHRCTLIDIQAEASYDISDPNEAVRAKGLSEMKTWIDTGATLEAQFVRISAMKKSYEKSVESVKYLTQYAASKGIQTLVENHFDLFSNPENHVAIIKDVASNKLGLLADFGNYPPSTAQYDALKKIAPFTKLVSAKTSEFDERMQHTSFDFGRCVNIFKEMNYQGVYALEQWGKPNPAYDEEKITDWMISEVSARLAS